MRVAVYSIFSPLGLNDGLSACNNVKIASRARALIKEKKKRITQLECISNSDARREILAELRYIRVCIYLRRLG
jgi:hypothetical protein